MPVPYLQKLAKEGHGSIESLEQKWSEAKKAAAGEGHADDYAYITGIFKKMAGVTASVETASPVKPGSPREVAAKNKTAEIATKLLAGHLRPCKTLLVKGVHVTHSWAPDKAARRYASPNYAYTALIPAKGFMLTLDDQMQVARSLKNMYKDIGKVVVYGTPHGMLIAIPFNSGLAHSELLDDLYS